MKLLRLSILIMLSTLAMSAFADDVVRDGNYRTIANVRSDGTIMDGNYRTIGHIRSDGTVMDSNYRTIGHGGSIRRDWLAYFIFVGFGK